jgi:Cu-processing system permease protein
VLAKLPARVFGSAIHDTGAALAKVVPNLMWYVPPRTLLTGEAVGDNLTTHLLLAAAYAASWAVALLTVAAVVFKRRDFL